MREQFREALYSGGGRSMLVKHEFPGQLKEKGSVKARRIIAGFASLAAAAAISGLAAIPAQAAPAAHQAAVVHMSAAMPMTTNTWNDNKDTDALYFSNPIFTVSGSNSTGIGTAVNCSGGWCQHKVGSDCMEYLGSGGGQAIGLDSCDTGNDQEWKIFHTTDGGGGDVWENEAATTDMGCTGGAVMSSNGAGVAVTVACPFGAGGTYGKAQVWQGS